MGAIKNSCIYECKVMHYRSMPLVNKFDYSVFMFYIDLNEIETITKKILGISRNTFNIFSFRDSDHLEFPRENPIKGKSTQENIKIYLAEKGVYPARIMLLTNLRTLGYQFNPVSFYYCFDENDNPIANVVEIGNTYGEQKPYYISREEFDGKKYMQRVQKYFYISPFTDLKDEIDFNLFIPGEKLDIRIDDFKYDGTKFFVSTLKGARKELNNFNTFLYAVKFPLITLKVIGLINWQAFKLWLRKLPYHAKKANLENQKEVYKAYSK